MPELPEVKTVVKHLKEHLCGQTIVDVIINKSKLIKEVTNDEFKKQIVTQRINTIDNYGKFIVFHLSNDVILLSHLRMEGKYRVINNLQKLIVHDHLIFALRSGSYLVYNDSRQFGTFHLRTKQNYQQIKPLVLIANEPKNINQEIVYKKLQKKHIAIKTALLDQTIMAGLGNIYVNEVLWNVQINPETKAHLISRQQLETIIQASTIILEKATALGGSTIKSFAAFNQSEGQFQAFLQVHNRYNEPCQRCQTLIDKKKINGRGTYFCPQCQS